ncbi:MAG: LPS assembly lipoprotein LptE [Desulfobulbaceae bacterium]|nr:LPS assembly lipoprotein LptE [Desulfobulbaceae bacterium]HIJ78719.1 LptE family protein [Deltaproteobacteria bacterium]
MRITNPIFKLCLGLYFITMAACGYHNPNMRSAEEQGPAVTIYVPLWNNPTNETRLATDIHNTLQDWLLQSKRIKIAATADSADYIMTGKINSIRYPGRSYDQDDTAQGLKAILSVEYTVTDSKNGKIAWQAKNFALEENYALAGSSAETDTNKKKALEILVNNLGEHIYIKLARALSRYQKSQNIKQ